MYAEWTTNVMIRLSGSDAARLSYLIALIWDDEVQLSEESEKFLDDFLDLLNDGSDREWQEEPEELQEYRRDIKDEEVPF